MKLIVHTSTDPECPEGMRFIGHFVRPNKTGKAELLSIRFAASSDAAVRTKAGEFLAQERDRAARDIANKERLREMRRAEKPQNTSEE